MCHSDEACGASVSVSEQILPQTFVDLKRDCLQQMIPVFKEETVVQGGDRRSKRMRSFKEEPRDTFFWSLENDRATIGQQQSGAIGQAQRSGAIGRATIGQRSGIIGHDRARCQTGACQTAARSACLPDCNRAIGARLARSFSSDQIF